MIYMKHTELFIFRTKPRPEYMFSLLLYFNYLLSVTAGWSESPEGPCSEVLRLTSVD